MYYNLFFPEQITAGKYHFLLYMHDRSTGERRVYLHPYEWSDTQYNDGITIARFYFEDGNGSCDCNRSLWFYEQEDAELDEPRYGCLDDNYPSGKIKIERLVCLETGETIATDI